MMTHYSVGGKKDKISDSTVLIVVGVVVVLFLIGCIVLAIVLFRKSKKNGSNGTSSSSSKGTSSGSTSSGTSSSGTSSSGSTSSSSSGTSSSGGTSSSSGGSSSSLSVYTDVDYVIGEDDVSSFDANKTYGIKSYSGLHKLANLVNDGKSASGVKIYLLNDISLSSSYTPIGASGYPFKGEFNGNGYSITMTKSISFSKSYAGIFGYVYNGSIKNLFLKRNSDDVSLSDSNYMCVGGICGYMESGTIENCGNEVPITCNSYGGGIIGYGKSITITSSYNAGDITCANYAGGLMAYGSDSITISYSYNTGYISNNNKGAGQYMGGLIGVVDGTTSISSAFNSGNIESSNSNKIGGILGYASSTKINITACYNTGNIYSTTNNYYAGGIVGMTKSSIIAIESCYNTGNVENGDIICGESSDIEYTINNNYYLSTITYATNTYNAEATNFKDSNIIDKLGEDYYKLDMYNGYPILKRINV